MKTMLQNAIKLSALLMILIVSAAAQTSAKVTVPFAFKVGTKTLPAGEYRIEPVSQNFTELLALRDGGGARRVVIHGVREELLKSESHARLVFNRYGDDYFLAQIWPSEGSSGVSLLKSQLERELAASGADVRETQVAMGN